MHEGHRNRLKNRFLIEGLDSFEQHQILELVLFYAIPRKDVNELAHKLLRRFGSLSRVLEADVKDIMNVDGIGLNAAVLLALIPSLARNYYMDKREDRPIVNNPEKAGEYAIPIFIGRIYEAFFLICIDAQNRIIHSALVHEGTIDEAPIYPRLIVEAALRNHAHSVILAHNHPGGSPLPSKADIDATTTIISALQHVDIKVIDHIIVAKDKYSSFVEMGLLPNNF